MSGRDDRPVKVSLDATAVPAHPAGAGLYVIELARALAGRPDVELTVLSRRGDRDRWALLGGVRSTGDAPGHRPLRLAWEQVRLPRLLSALAVDLHHAPHYTMPERAPVPTVVTIHDLSFLEHPEWHERLKVPIFRRAIRTAAAQAAALVAVSVTTAERLQSLLSPQAPVHVAPHGVDHDRYRPLDPHETAQEEADEAARRRIGARAPYIAFVGTLEPRKDVPTLVRAFDRLAATHPDVGLVLAGARGWGADAADGAVAGAAHAQRVHLSGYVSEDEKVALLRGATAVAYASLDEGFGLPALEAMACGAPLVTSAGTAMAEMAGDAALLVTPGNANELAAALEVCLEGGTEVARRRQLGLDRASRYTWAACADAHVAVYRSVVG